MPVLGVGLIGAGVVGGRRAEAIADDPGARLVAVADIDLRRAQQIASLWGGPHCKPVERWDDVVADGEVDVVIVSAVNQVAAPAAIAALGAGKHVLCEKPLGRNAEEAGRMVKAARAAGRYLKTGFTLRCHPAVQHAREIARSGKIGPLLYARCVYGHGGRPGYDQEWRADPESAGGGELLDQGVHVVDLFRCFFGNFHEVYGMLATHFWNLGSFAADGSSLRERAGLRLEDNAFAFLRSDGGQEAMLHTSWTQWKNRFEFEIFGQDGFLKISGLGGSYGTEYLTLGMRRPESGPPDEKTWEYPGPDLSWCREWQNFSTAIREGHPPEADGQEGLEAMRLIDAIYESAKTGRRVLLHRDIRPTLNNTAGASLPAD